MRTRTPPRSSLAAATWPRCTVSRPAEVSAATRRAVCGRHPVAVHLPVTGDVAQEQALVRLRQLFPEAGDLRPQRVHDVLPVAGVGGGAGPDIADQPGQAERASRAADDRRWAHGGRRARPVVLAGEQRVAGDGVDGRARVGVGERDRHVQHGQAGAQHGDRAAVRRRLQRAGLPWVGDVAVPVRDRAGRSGRQVAGGQHGGVGVDPPVGRQVQAQRAAVAAAPDRHDRRGDAADPRRRPRRSFRRREAVSVR